MIYLNGKMIPTLKIASLIIPISVEIYPATLTNIGENPDYKGAITEGVSGMTKYKNSTDKDELFLAFRDTSNVSQDIGFTIDLGGEQSVGVMLLRGWGDYRGVELQISTSTDDNDFSLVDTITHTSGGAQTTHYIYINDDIRYIRVIQPLQSGGMNYRFIYRSVELFAPIRTVGYKIVQRAEGDELNDTK
jgi:hypothetical protein